LKAVPPAWRIAAENEFRCSARCEHLNASEEMRSVFLDKDSKTSTRAASLNLYLTGYPCPSSPGIKAARGTHLA
jgi:hypothetical protein